MKTKQFAQKKDYLLGALAGLLLGLLFLPVLKAGLPEVYKKFNLLVVPFFLIATPLGFFVANILAKKIAVIWQLSKFVVIGGLNGLVDLGILAMTSFVFLSYFKINSTDIFWQSEIYLVPLSITFYTLFKTFSFIIANINSYFWNKYWTFQNQTKTTKSKFGKFFLVSVIGLFINVLTASYIFNSITPLLEMKNSQWELIGAVFGSFAGLAWNFIGYKFLVFKK